VGRVEDATILQTVDGQSAAFQLNHHFAPDASNEVVYNELIAPLAPRVLEGFNASVITYGATRSGKMYTLCGETSGRDAGLIERAAHDIFARIGSDSSQRYLVTFSMLQIAQELVTDAMSPVVDGSVQLAVEAHRAFGAYVPGLCELVVHGADEVKEYLQQGAKVIHALLKRRNASVAAQQGQAAVALSAMQSLPHFIVDLHVESQQNGNMVSPIRYSTLRFVHTVGCGGLARDMDDGLRSVVSVIDTLASGKPAYSAPYSGSALTKLLEGALGGNSNTVFLACLHSFPADTEASDLEHTLAVAQRAQLVPNRSAANLNTLASTMQELREDIRKARGKLNLQHPGNYLNELDPKQLEGLRNLLAELERVKENTWEAKITLSKRYAEARKETLHKAGLYLVLEEDIPLDGELLRKVEKERRNLVLQTYVVEQKDAKFARELELFRAWAVVPQGEAPREEKDIRKREDELREMEKNCAHQVRVEDITVMVHACLLAVCLMVIQV